jgi:DinB superfamily
MNEQKMRDNLASQYRAAIAMLGQAIELCPEPLWLDPAYVNRFWHIAYHALFYTHLYLQPDEADPQFWGKHRKDAQYLGHRPWFPPNAPRIEPAYSKAELLEFHAICRAEVELRMRSIDLDAPSGFSWLPFNKLELQLYNIRHLQHHIGQLADRLRNSVGIGIDWVCPD